MSKVRLTAYQVLIVQSLIVDFKASNGLIDGQSDSKLLELSVSFDSIRSIDEGSVDAVSCKHMVPRLVVPVSQKEVQNAICTISRPLA